MRPPLRGDERWLWRGRWRAMVVFGLRLRLGVIMHFYCRCKSGKYGNLVTEDYLTINPLVIHYVVKIILFYFLYYSWLILSFIKTNKTTRPEHKSSFYLQLFVCNKPSPVSPSADWQSSSRDVVVSNLVCAPVNCCVFHRRNCSHTSPTTPCPSVSVPYVVYHQNPSNTHRLLFHLIADVVDDSLTSASGEIISQQAGHIRK